VASKRARKARRLAPRLPLTGYCQECAKVRYLSRSDARLSADRMPQRMRAYRCPGNEQFWHLASWAPAGRVAYYRDREAVSPDA